jgi:hypothetical protein
VLILVRVCGEFGEDYIKRCVEVNKKSRQEVTRIIGSYLNLSSSAIKARAPGLQKYSHVKNFTATANLLIF